MVYFAFLFIQNDQKQTNGNAAAAAAHSSILDAATIQFNMCVFQSNVNYTNLHIVKKKTKKNWSRYWESRARPYVHVSVCLVQIV